MSKSQDGASASPCTSLLAHLIAVQCMVSTGMSSALIDDGRGWVGRGLCYVFHWTVVNCVGLLFFSVPLLSVFWNHFNTR